MEALHAHRSQLPRLKTRLALPKWLGQPMLFASAASLALSGCYVEVRENPPAERSKQPGPESMIIGGSAEDFHPDWVPPGLRSQARECHDPRLRLENATASERFHCFQHEDYTWRVSCRSSDCQSVPLHVHYMLSEDLGVANVVNVEAFDNPRFVGAPVGTVQIYNFAASKPGQYEKAEMYLSPGEYYVRAYLGDNEDNLLPYRYQGMTLLSDRPVGVFGALSGAEKLVVKPRHQERWVAPLNVYLDQLFKKDGPEAASGANLRILFQVDSSAVIERGRKLILQLHASSDLAQNPLRQFEVASENLLVEGRRGQGEFVATDLEPGQYVVFAFLDGNGNGFHDPGELARLHASEGEAKSIAIKANRTETVELKLQSP